MLKRRLTNKVKTFRVLAKDMTQSELGELVGVTRQTIAAIESGKYSPSLVCAFRIAEVVGQPLQEVFHWEK
jgi:putative transcriptional regulator